MSDVRELIRREPSQDEHDAIRELWKRHSVAEDNRDLPGLLATLTDDCVYELVQTGHRWEGHEARPASTVACSARSPTSTST